MIKKPQFQKGAASIILAILILSALLLVGIGMSALMIQQIKLTGQVGQSVVAFYAADAGAERCLYQIRCITEDPIAPECMAEVGPGMDQGCAGGGTISDTLDIDGRIRYTATYNGLDLMQSIGRYLVTSRKLQLTW